MPQSPSTRDLVVVDLETCGLDPSIDVTVEVAWINMSTGSSGVFIPPHDVEYVRVVGAPKALALCRYNERLASGVQENRWDELRAELEGNTLAGANSQFDAQFLRAVGIENWHYRLGELENYFGGWFGLPPNQLFGLEKICEELGVENAAPHTAWGDADATSECFEILFDHLGVSV